MFALGTSQSVKDLPLLPRPPYRQSGAERKCSTRFQTNRKPPAQWGRRCGLPQCIAQFIHHYILELYCTKSQTNSLDLDTLPFGRGEAVISRRIARQFFFKGRMRTFRHAVGPWSDCSMKDPLAVSFFIQFPPVGVLISTFS